jgi:uncharacterized membrane protein
MQDDLVEKMSDPRESSLRIFQSDSSYQSVNLVAKRQQKLSKITSVLPGDSGDESFFSH